MPATFCSTRLAAPLAALIPLAENSGNASRIPSAHNPTPASTISATLRYVTVVHAMWMAGLRVDEDTLTKNLLQASEYAVISTLPQAH